MTVTTQVSNVEVWVCVDLGVVWLFSTVCLQMPERDCQTVKMSDFMVSLLPASRRTSLRSMVKIEIRMVNARLAASSLQLWWNSKLFPRWLMTPAAHHIWCSNASEINFHQINQVNHDLIEFNNEGWCKTFSVLEGGHCGCTPLRCSV